MEEEEALIRAQPELLIRMVVGTDLLAHLEAAGVINIITREIIQSKKTNHEQVVALLEHVRRDISGRYCPFTRALIDTNQEHIVALIEDSSTQVSEAGLQHQDAPSTWMKQLIEKYKHISRTLPIFKDTQLTKRYIVDMTKLFTRLELIQGWDFCENETGADDVSLEEVLDGSTRNIVFQGTPGCGKTSALVHILTTCGEEMLQEGHTEQSRYKIMKDVNSLFYVRPEDCKDSLDETIKAILADQCPEHSDQAYQQYKYQPQQTGIIFDSLDELSHRRELIKDILREMEKKNRVILAGCRSHDPVIDSLIHAEHVRHVRVKGFDQRAISTYIEKYFLSNDETKLDVVEENSIIVESFKQSLEADRRLQGFLTNPMTLCLVCILIKAGKYDPNNLSGLTKIAIYSDVEELALGRQGLEVKNEAENLKIFHKYALCAIVNSSGFYQKEMAELGINVCNLPFISVGDMNIESIGKGGQVLWPHKSFSEYCAAKCLTECTEQKQEELLLFLAAHRHLMNTLIFILELLQPKEELLFRIVRHILALQPKFLRPWHFLTCHSKASEKINEVISNIRIDDILEKRERVINIPADHLHPCKKCWRKLDFVSSIEGRAIINNGQKCIQTSLVKESRARVATQTITPLLTKRKGHKGLPLPVPNTDRCVTLRAKMEGDIVINANRPVDVITARVYNVLGDKSIETVTMDLDKMGDVYGEEDHSPNKGEWAALIKDFTKNTPHLTGKGLLHFMSQSDSMLQELCSHLVELKNHGVKQMLFKVEEGICINRREMASLTTHGWHILYWDLYIYMSTDDWPVIFQEFFERTHLSALNSSLHFPSPSRALLHILPVHMKDMEHHGIKQVLLNAGEGFIKSEHISMKKITDAGWQVIHGNDMVCLLSSKNWPHLLMDLIRNKPSIIEKGSLNFLSYKNSLLRSLSHLWKELKDSGVKQLTVDEDLIESHHVSMNEVTANGWQAINGHGKVHLLRSEEWPLLLLDLISSEPSFVGNGCLSFLSHNDFLLKSLPSLEKDLLNHGVKQIMIRIREDIIKDETNFVYMMADKGWQVIYGEGTVFLLSPESWPLLLQELIQINPSLTRDGSLTFLSHNTALLRSLPSLQKDILTLKVSQIIININEDLVQNERAFLKKQTDNRWQVIYGDGNLHLLSPDCWPSLLMELCRNGSSVIEHGSLKFLSHDDSLLRSLPRIYQDVMNFKVKLITVDIEEHFIKSKSISGLWKKIAESGGQVVYGNGMLHFLSSVDWPLHLLDLIRNKSSIIEKGSLTFLSYNQTLLTSLPNLEDDLMNLGINQIVIRVDKDRIRKLSFNWKKLTENGWQIIHVAGAMYILHPSEWRFLLNDLMRKIPTVVENSSLTFPSPNFILMRSLPTIQKVFMNFGIKQIMIDIDEDAIMSTHLDLKKITDNGWQVIYGSGTMYLLPSEDWPLVRQDLVRNASSLYFFTHTEFLLKTHQLECLMYPGLRQILMKMGEDDISSGKINVPDVLKFGWKVIHTEGWLHLQSPGCIKRLDGDVKLVPVPGSTSCWVRLEEKGGLKIQKLLPENKACLKIYSHQPEDVITSQAFRVSNHRPWDSLDLYMNQSLGIYTNNPMHYTPAETWRCLLEEGPRCLRLRGQGSLWIHLGGHNFLGQQGVSCHDYDSLLEVLPGLITKLHDGGVRLFKVLDGRIRGKSLMKLVQKLRESWDIGQSSGHGVGICRRGTKDEVMHIRLSYPVIRVKSSQERAEVSKSSLDINLCGSEKWEVFSD